MSPRRRTRPENISQSTLKSNVVSTGYYSGTISLELFEKI